MSDKTPEQPKPKRAYKRQKKLEKNLKVGMIEHGAGGGNATLGPNDLISGIRGSMGTDPNDKALLQKSVQPQKVAKDVEGKYAKSKIVFGSRYNKSTSDNIDV